MKDKPMAQSSDHNLLDPHAIAEMLGLSLTALARLVCVSRATIVRTPLGPRGHEALQPISRILTQATEMTGSEREAGIWFRYQPIASMGTRTAMEHVAAGNADTVLLHLEDVRNGVYA